MLSLSGLFTRFDLTVLVVEPTLRSLSVYDQYRSYARDHDVTIRVMANKLDDADDRDFVRDRVGEDLIDGLSRSSFIKAMEKGRVLPLGDWRQTTKRLWRHFLSPSADRKDWDRYHRDAILFHQRNAASWANDAVGSDLTHQVDPEFSMSEAARAILCKRRTLDKAA